SLDDGRFPVKRIVGDQVLVQADILADGHDRVAAAVLWRVAGQRQWRQVAMRHLGNDRWCGEFPLERLGRHEFTVEAWRDDFATARMDLEKRLAAGNLSRVDLDEVLHLVRATADASGNDALATLADALEATDDPQARSALLLAPDTANAMARHDRRPFLARCTTVYPVEAERLAAGFSSWYELFPRSQAMPNADGVQPHGTFHDVIARLPAIRDMGFDVLYMPPIHPIGRSNRKGRNNSVTAEPGEPGSPYAIGAVEGGHDAVHPELGTLDDFRQLVSAAASHGLELALDFAIQCSPDHPWLRDHPDWFAWRADGSIRYAENPPKKYEDIVNVDFYASGSIPGLWTALRDVVAFWVNEGVRLFRVDNPHTKPFPFWEWMIGDIRATHPDVVFLSEAFTRPKLMYRLAKVGYSQSYTYFTWRNRKAELIEYMTELADGAPSEFFRPHFFVNTPDINPVFLHDSGRAGHLVRAALATTLSGLWGMYSGFELCEATPLKAGKEDYLDSEKYQLRAWDWDRPGNIVAEITRLNLLRRLNPALQTHLGVRFYNAANDNVLYFGKRRGSHDDIVLVAINLDPFNVQETDFELPLWEFGLPDHGALQVEDLWRGTRTTWQGKQQRVRLDPAELPFAIWRVGPGRTENGQAPEAAR
ncbi:MAG TPA: alpha-1,4-glucan--maltose-1-phosphate maltosyltransferase, partial [Luteimonas sp.]|nr:alpha-1,4-glucan--maltose-1-phosphate maltosyltransferase [Luteimonas sp.]